MNIKTIYDPKPIQLRQFDWEAWDDDNPEIGTGYGLTEQEALEDLKQKLKDDSSPGNI